MSKSCNVITTTQLRRLGAKLNIKVNNGSGKAKRDELLTAIKSVFVTNLNACTALEVIRVNTMKHLEKEKKNNLKDPLNNRRFRLLNIVFSSHHYDDFVKYFKPSSKGVLQEKKGNSSELWDDITSAFNEK